MYKKLTLIIITIVVLFSQPLSSQWAKSYGGEGLNFEPVTIQNAHDGGYITGGIFFDSNGDFSGWVGWIMKLSVSGAVEWIKQYSPVLSLTPTLDGGYAAVGWDTIFKIDVSGDLIWHKQVKIRRFSSIKQTSDGGFIASGGLYDRNEGSSYCIIKFSPKGKVKWKRKFAINDYGEEFHSIRETSDGGYIAVGNTKYPPPFPPAFWIMKINHKGRIRWQKRFGGMDSHMIKDFIITSEGDYLLMGEHEIISLTSWDSNIWVTKIRPDGQIVWQKEFIGSGYEMPKSLITTQDDGYFVVGVTSLRIDLEFFALKLNPKGKMEWCRTFGGDNGNGYTDMRNYAYSACQANKGRYVILGNSEFPDQSRNTVNAFRQKDITVLKLNKQGNFSSCLILQNYPGFTAFKTSYPLIDFRYGFRDFPTWTWDVDLEVKDIQIEVDDDICFKQY